MIGEKRKAGFRRQIMPKQDERAIAQKIMAAFL